MLRVALTKRFIYKDILQIAKDYGIHYDDVRADVHPLEFARLLSPLSSSFPQPDWGNLSAGSDQFTPDHFPHAFNSEPSVSRFLGELAFFKPAKTVIELGSFVGWTTAHLAKALQGQGGGKIFAVDPSQEYLDTMLGNLQRHGLQELVTPVRGYSEDKKVVNALPKEADIIFIDTGHNYPQTLREVSLYKPHLAPGGFMVLHDSMSAPGVRKSLLEVKGFRKMTFGTERSNGVTVLVQE